jgi:GNAT superfamily N-acetyltransferase
MSPLPDSHATTRVAVLPKVSDEAFEAILRIYEEAIPAAERRSAAGLRRLFNDSRYRLIASWEERKLTGFAVVYVGSAVCLLEYMAVDRAFRDRGLGKLLCDAAAALVDGLQPRRPLFAEVDADEGDAPDLLQRQRRKAFYARLGFSEAAGFQYFLPLEGAEAMESMHIVVYGVAETLFSAAAFRRCITQIYTEVYGKTADDPRIDRMMRPVRDGVRFIRPGSDRD